MGKLLRVIADQTVLADKVVNADTYPLRKKGLLGRTTLSLDEGALLCMPYQTRLSLFFSIHMFGMPFSLAAAWIDRDGNILQAILAQPGRIYFPSGLFTDTGYILELHPAHLPTLQNASRITWEEVDG